MIVERFRETLWNREKSNPFEISSWTRTILLFWEYFTCKYFNEKYPRICSMHLIFMIIRSPKNRIISTFVRRNVSRSGITAGQPAKNVVSSRTRNVRHGLMRLRCRGDGRETLFGQKAPERVHTGRKWEQKSFFLYGHAHPAFTRARRLVLEWRVCHPLVHVFLAKLPRSQNSGPRER